MANLRLSSL